APQESPSDGQPDPETAHSSNSDLQYSPNLENAKQTSLSAAHVDGNCHFPSTDEQTATEDNRTQAQSHDWIAGVYLCAKAAAFVLQFGRAARVSRFRPTPILTITKRDVHHQAWGPSHVAQNSSERLDSNSLIKPVEYRKLIPRKRLINVPDRKILVAVFFLCLATIGSGAALFQMSIYTSTGDDNNSLPKRMLDSVVVANIPQLLITLSYYGYNNLMTTMLAAAEYDSYGVSYKSLRVTWPEKDSQQKSTYWLSIPYQYAVPILVLCVALHWLVSQSTFYVLRIPYTPQGEAVWSDSISSLGFSPLLIFCALLIGSFIICLLILLSLKRFKSNMPLAGSCSAVICAACHPRNMRARILLP
ncbi:hypothetical protein N7516_005235, partial [Penicillium verrucosum]|uniref:uncharacterized protein n=1 Tax=Penicillium verrucosum TaxID=60171 RepID=UPI0025454632